VPGALARRARLVLAEAAVDWNGDPLLAASAAKESGAVVGRKVDDGGDRKVLRRLLAGLEEEGNDRPPRAVVEP